MRSVKYKSFVNGKIQKVMKIFFNQLEKGSTGRDVYFQVEDGSSHGYDGSNLFQYTGIKDKNDLEIYEGDIVTIDWRVESKKYVVKWNNKSNSHLGCYVFESNDGSWIGSAGRDVVVIGNIYENKDLLEDL